MKFWNSVKRFGAVPCASGVMAVAFAFPALAADTAAGSSGTITDMLEIFSQLFAWILDEGATLLTWMLNKPILMCSMGLFFCGAIIAFLMRIYHSV